MLEQAPLLAGPVQLGAEGVGWEEGSWFCPQVAECSWVLSLSAHGGVSLQCLENFLCLFHCVRKVHLHVTQDLLTFCRRRKKKSQSVAPRGAMPTQAAEQGFTLDSQRREDGRETDAEASGAG
ncbi:unnamed protein product [Arctogadus glacialis]